MTSLALYTQALALIDASRPFVLAAVVEATGSTPQRAGALAIVEPNGEIHGTLGGGCLEAEARKRALDALDEGEAKLFALKLDEVTGWDDGLICGGHVRIFVNPKASANAVAYRRALDASAAHDEGALITVLHHPKHPAGTAFWIPSGALEDDCLIPREAVATIRTFLRKEKAGIIGNHTALDAAFEGYVEPVIPAPQLIIAGGGHIGHAVCRLATTVGFDVTVIDDRPRFASATCHPDAKQTRCGEIASELSEAPTSEHTYILIVTRGHRHDGSVLAAALQKPARYIGMIGSRRKGLLIRRRLIEEGHASLEAMEKVVSPIGLDIGAQSVEEIAVSIVSQLIAVRRKGELEGGALNHVPSSLRSS